MRKTILLPISIITLSITLLTGCETLLYKPDVNQGNYLANGDAQKVTKGMTQEQVLYLLGSPITTDVFDKTRWIYIYRQDVARKAPTQETLVITFDESGVVSNLEYKPNTN